MCCNGKGRESMVAAAPVKMARSRTIKTNPDVMEVRVITEVPRYIKGRNTGTRYGRRNPGDVIRLYRADFDDELFDDTEDVMTDESIQKGGPGTYLARLVSLLGYKKSGACDCRHIEAMMNRLGPDGCRGRMDYLVSAIIKSAGDAGYSVTETWSRRAVSIAVAASSLTA